MFYSKWPIYQDVYLKWVRKKQVKSYLQQVALGKKPLFIHINRTGGSSISSGLGITSIHHTLGQYEALWREQFGQEMPGDIPVFTAVRNPYERAVSQYYYRKKHNQNKLATKPLSFSQWLDEVHVKKNPKYRDREIMFMPQLDWLKASGDFEIHLIRFEQLNENYKKLLAPYQITVLPWKKPSDRPAYEEVLDSKTKALIAKAYASDFKSFNYTV